MEDIIMDQKKERNTKRFISLTPKKANKINSELLSFTKEEIKRKSKFGNIKHFSITKKIVIKKEDKKIEEKKIEQSTNIINNDENSDTYDSEMNSSDMSSCEEEIIIQYNYNINRFDFFLIIIAVLKNNTKIFSEIIINVLNLK